MKLALSLKILWVLALVLFLNACNIPQTSVPSATRPATSAPAVPTPTNPAVDPTATQVPSPQSPTEAPEQTSTKTTQPTQAAPTSTSEFRGFVVFDTENKEFLGYDLEGNQLFRHAAGAIQYPAPREVEVAGDNVYFYSSMDKKLFRANNTGLTFLPNLAVEKLSAFAISPDETLIAWSSTDWDATPITSALWIANLDGSNARQIATYNSDQSPAFFLVPLEWTDDGQLLFERSLTGMGGYILYGGYNSLYAYNPADQQFTTYVPAEDLVGLCVDSYRMDLKRVIFHCDHEGPGIKIRNLEDQSIQEFPTSPEYPTVGTARYSPSGQWLAFGAARGNPENEAGKVVVVPADLSSASQAILSVEDGFFTVQSWLDENTLLVARNDDPVPSSMLLKVSRDGQQTKELARGWFVGMLR